MVLALTVLLGGCAVAVSGSPSAAPATYTDPAGRFALVPPPGWTVEPGGAQSGPSVVFRDPDPPGAFATNINVLVVPAGSDLRAVVVLARTELRDLPDYRTTADEPFTLADTTPAHVLGGTVVDGASGVALRNLQLFAVHEGSTVVATATSAEQNWDDVAAAFDASLGTLTVRP